LNYFVFLWKRDFQHWQKAPSTDRYEILDV
jgi:hypothetical protein